MKLSRAEIKTRLENRGFFFSDRVLTVEGAYAAEDAVWNYVDLAHLRHVHPQNFNPCVTYAREDGSAFINSFDILGFRLPHVVVNTLTEPGCYTYYAALGPAVFINESFCEETASGARVTTTYSVGTARWLKWTHPFIHWMLKRNHRRLAVQDEPMRLRRQQLRSWGYRFRPQSWRDCESTMKTERDNVII